MESPVDLNKGAELPQWDNVGLSPAMVSLAKERELSTMKGSVSSRYGSTEGPTLLRGRSGE